MYSIYTVADARYDRGSSRWELKNLSEPNQVIFVERKINLLYRG